jgi:O-antigen/teichoic acid export membrane protein
MKQLNIMACCGMILNISLNLVLIPRLQVFGSAVSSLTTQAITALAQILMVQYLFRFRVNYKLLGSLAVFITFAIVSNILISRLQTGWQLRFAMAAGASFALAFALRLISIKNLIHIVKYEE